jgi:hypothetical protein
MTVAWRWEDEFYDSDTRREHSREVDYGTGWTDGTGGQWRISYLVSTGELVAVRRGPVPLQHGVAGATHAAVELLGWVPDQAAADRLMKGWQQLVPLPMGGGMRDLRARIRKQAIRGDDVTERHRQQAHAASIGAVGAAAPDRLFDLQTEPDGEKGNRRQKRPGARH